MNSTKQKRISLKTLLACFLLLTTQIATLTYAREMQPGSDAYTFSTYMIDAFYSEGEECEEKLLATPTIGWLCAAFPLGQRAFEDRWDAYLSALPQNYNITAVSPWGDIRYEEDDSVFYGKIYDLNDGRLVVGYDRSDRGREIRIGFSSTANQAMAEQRKLEAANNAQNQAQVAQAQAAQTQAAQTMQIQPAQTQIQPAQQAPVFLSQEETRARELAEAAVAQYEAQNTARATQSTQSSTAQANTAQVNQATTQQTGTFQSYNSQTGLNTSAPTSSNTNSYASTATPVQQAKPVAPLHSTSSTNQAATAPVTNQRAYATTQQNSTLNSSTAMSTAATTTMATSAVMNSAQNTAAQSMPQATSSSAMSTAATTTMATSAVVNTAQNMPQATNSSAMANATTTNLATSSVIANAPTTSATTNNATTNNAAATTQTTMQAATPVKPIKTQEVMALAQPKQAPQATALSATGILDVFREKGLAVNSVKDMTPKDYGFAPVLANEGIFFRLGDCTSCIGRIFSFDRKEDVAMMEVYYSLEAQATDVVYSQDKVLLQFFSTPKDIAEQYITELKALN